MNTFTIIFLAALVLSYAVELWLARRQFAHVEAHRDAVPEAFAASITLEAHQKAGIDLTELSAKLQSDGANSFVDSWHELLAAIESKSKVLA